MLPPHARESQARRLQRQLLGNSMTDGRTLRCCTIVIVITKAMLLTSSFPVRHGGLIHEVDASTNTSSRSVFSGGRLIQTRVTEIPGSAATHRRQGDRAVLDPCNCAAWLCDNGFYQEADSYTGCEACKPCPTVCPDGMWMSGLCTPVHSGCSACRVCSADEYISTACGGSQQTVCSKCTACAAGYFANISCSATADNVCVECPNAKANFSFFTGIYNATASLCLWQCNPTTNLSNTGTCECAPGRFYSMELDLNNFDISSQAYRPKGCIQCQGCAPGTFVARQADGCSTARDRRCSPCPNKLPQLATWTGTYADGFCQYACPAGRVPSRKVDPERNGSFVDSCACARGYYTEDGGATCKQCRTCSDSQYTESACESTRNTQCGSCSGLKPLNSEFTSYSTLLGRCNWRCKAGYFQPGDRQECSACTNCILGQYVKSDCTPNQDRECSPCPNRPPPHSSYTGDFDPGSLRCTFKCDETFVEVVKGPRFDQKSCQCPAGMSMPTGGTRCGPCKTCQATGSLVATASEAVSQWAVAPCAAVGTDTICADCTKCNSTEYVSSPCNAAGDTVCQQCARCDWPNQWMQSACSSGWSGWFSDTTEWGTVDFEMDVNATTVTLTPAILTLQVGEYLKTSAHEYMLVTSIVHANSSTVTVERNGIATSAPFGLIPGKTETVQAGSNVTRAHAIVSNSSNSLNHIGHDTVCRACSRYQCPLGQHGVQCGYFSDTTCANCSNAIPDFAHWTGTWSPPNPAPGSVVKCHYDCNPLFVLISNTTSPDECQCSVGRYLHTFTPNEAHSFTQTMLPTARGECRKCDVCKEGERILTACNRTHNTVCIPCPQAMTFAANASVQHFHMTKACLGTNSCSVIFDRVEADVELSIAVVLTGAANYTASLFTEGRSFELDLEQEGLQSSATSGCDQRHDILRQRTIETKTAHTNRKFTLLITSSSSSQSCPATEGSSTMFSLLAYVTINRARARFNHSATSGTVYDNEIGRCEWQCDEGYQKTANGTGCDCGDGRYVNSDNAHGGACLNCTSCPLASVSHGRGQMVLETCTRTKNAVCVDCCNDKPPDSSFSVTILVF